MPTLAFQFPLKLIQSTWGEKLNYVINCKLKKEVQKCQNAYYHQHYFHLFCFEG